MSKLKLQSLWLYLVFISFFYELPVFVISFDRLNPRLLDIAFIIGLFIRGDKLFNKTRNVIYHSWSKIVLWFSLCAIISVMFLTPSNAKLYSLLAIVRYIESLLLIKMVLSVDFDKKILLRSAFVGLIFDSMYCIYQLSHPAVRELTPGNFVEVDYLTGPLSSSYFEIAQLLPLAFIVIVSLSHQVTTSSFKRLLIQIISVLLCWPLLFTGSRTGLILMLVTILTYFVSSGLRGVAFLSLLTVLGFGLFQRFDSDSSQLYTITRALFLEEEEDGSVDDRLEVTRVFDFQNYDNALVMPFVGAGFNVAPINGHNRIDYGVHSMYLYPLEQAGIVGFILFLSFLVCCLKHFYKGKRSDTFVLGAFSYLIAMMVTGIGAHNFWREFSSGNINTFILLVFCLALKFNKNKYENITDK